MEKYEDQMKSLGLKLFEINAFKFGNFEMKVGVNSPVYFDLRVIVSYPEVMNELADLMVNFMKENQLTLGAIEHVCGVPYTALPIATLISVKISKSMLVRRKEAKNYGTKKMVEGKFSAGDRCLIIEDVVTSGSSILETVKDLRKEGINVTDTIVVVDREQGGVENIAENGVKMHSLFTLSYLMNVLKDAGKIDDTTVNSVIKYLQGCQIKPDGSFRNNSIKFVNNLERVRMSFSDRCSLAKSKAARLLFEIMTSKKTNLCLAADLTKCDEIIRVANQCGPYICILKMHIDIIEDFNENFISTLKNLAKEHNFLIMEDRKFADIGNTVSLQFAKGIYHIAEWADLVTAHSISGQSILQGLKAGQKMSEFNHHGVFLLAEMSSHGNLINDKYKEATIKMTTESLDVDLIAGVVCQNADCVNSPGLIQFTPGVKIDESSDDLGQQYQSPEYVVKTKGADIAVVGRGIISAKSVEKAALLYRDRLWNAYCERVGIVNNH